LTDLQSNRLPLLDVHLHVRRPSGRNGEQRGRRHPDCPRADLLTPLDTDCGYFPAGGRPNDRATCLLECLGQLGVGGQRLGRRNGHAVALSHDLQIGDQRSVGGLADGLVRFDAEGKQSRGTSAAAFCQSGSTSRLLYSEDRTLPAGVLRCDLCARPFDLQ
jgi:hypothetical protein